MTGLAYHWQSRLASIDRTQYLVPNETLRYTNTGYWVREGNFFSRPSVHNQEDAMRAYLANLTPTVRRLLAVSLIALAYPIVTVVLPAIIRAVVPTVVQSVLRLM